MASATQINIKEKSTSTNVLHYFRSCNYLFTLSAIPRVSFLQAVTTSQIEQLAEKYVIAKSAGKKNVGIDLPADSPARDEYGGNDLVDKFNAESPGRFNFYFDNIEIESIISFDKRTGFSKASSIAFSIIEPYSLAGLLEALQVTAVATGYPTYKAASFVLKLEFKGYPDWSDSGPINVENSTRYFIIRFSEMNIQSDEQGTKYSCKAVPLNELALGEPNKLKTNMNIQGNTVGEILENFAQALTNSSKETSEKSKSADNSTQPLFDTYEIKFPKVYSDIDFIDYEAEGDEIAKKKMGDLSVDNIAYAFRNPVTHEDQRTDLRSRGITKVSPYTPDTISTQFMSGSNIHDCISAIVRDSEYGVSIVKDITSKLDKNDNVDYFNIMTESLPQEWDSATSRQTYKHIFYVVPYKIHITQIPGQENGNHDVDKLRNRVYRKYDYLYTGKNVDILSFNLNFNYLYFQNQPLREGNQNIDGVGKIDNPKQPVTVTSNESAKDIASGAGASVARRVDINSINVVYSGESTRAHQETPYATMVRNLHESILNNVAMYQLEIEILGDPLYLVQNGIGNLRVESNPDHPGLTVTGDINAQSGPVYVEVTFKNPTDIDPTTGFLRSNNVASFSGIYRVNTVLSKFNNGAFTQQLSMIRIPGQPTDTYQTAPKSALSYSWDALDPNDTNYVYGEQTGLA
jgi:hypothetical protein